MITKNLLYSAITSLSYDLEALSNEVSSLEDEVKTLKAKLNKKETACKIKVRVAKKAAPKTEKKKVGRPKKK